MALDSLKDPYASDTEPTGTGLDSLQDPYASGYKLPEPEERGVVGEFFRAAGAGLLSFPKGVGTLTSWAGQAMSAAGVEGTGLGKELTAFGDHIVKSWDLFEKAEGEIMGISNPFDLSPAVGSVSDVRNTKQALQWAAGVLGQFTGQMAPTLVMGALTAAPKATTAMGKLWNLAKPPVTAGDVPIWLMEAGGIRSKIISDREKATGEGKPYEEPSLIKQLVGAGIAVKLERLAVDSLMKRTGLGADTAGWIAKSMPRRALEAAGIQSVAEGVQEFAQTYPEAYGSGATMKELFSLKQFVEALESGAAGAVGGAFFGAGLQRC